jgi:hypothetical protein
MSIEYKLASGSNLLRKRFPLFTDYAKIIEGSLQFTVPCERGFRFELPSALVINGIFN